MVNHKMSSKLLVVLMCMAWCPIVLAQGIPDGPYLGQIPPGMEPEIFAPGVISIPNRSERIGSFTPDGKEFYFTVTNSEWSGNRVMMTSQAEGVWSTPAVLPFSAYIEVNMYLSPDGQRLFFTSSRPVSSWLSFNIWMCERQGPIWSEPVKLAINSSRMDFAGTCTWSGTLYFASERDGPIAIFKSVSVAGKYTTVEKLPSPINTGQSEQCPWISPDESYLIFASSRQGSRDLYVSYRNHDDSWTEPVNLGPPINTQDYEWNPTVSSDGQYLFYSRCKDVSNINHDLYWVQTKAFLSDLTDPNGPVENQTTGQRFGSIQSAINRAAPGATIVIEPDVYLETINLNKNIVIQSVDPNDHIFIGSTIIEGDMTEPVLSLGTHSGACEIAGVTLRAGSVGITGIATDATIRNCRIMDNVIHGTELAQGSSPHLLGCLITANGQAGIKMHTFTEVRKFLYCEPIIENCYIVDNDVAGIIGGRPVIVDSVIQGQ
ncbi:MAG: hypothetical protein GY845_17830 [Planctomycetes bacterium]|nr:hypothetical protein [Planctomycetota bacterium]